MSISKKIDKVPWVGFHIFYLKKTYFKVISDAAKKMQLIE